MEKTEMPKLVKQVMHAGMQTQEFSAKRADLDGMLAQFPTVAAMDLSQVVQAPYVGAPGARFTVVQWAGKAPVVTGLFGAEYAVAPYEAVAQSLVAEADRRNIDSAFTARFFNNGASAALNVALPGARTELWGGDAFTPSVVALNSADGSLPVRMIGGGEVFVCQNGNLWGEIVAALSKKHGVELKALEAALANMARGMFDALFGYLPEFQARVRKAAETVVSNPSTFLASHGIGPRVYARVWERAQAHENTEVQAGTVWGLVNGVTRYARDLERGTWTKGEEVAGEPAPERARKYRAIADAILATVRA